jgi:dihydropteroate synthase
MTKIVGILNITPDSYSDGGKYFATNKAINHAKQMIIDGVDIIDIGAEATSGNKHQMENFTSGITQEEEWSRLKDILPEVINIAHQNNVQVSLDTRNYQTAATAINLGVNYINDVSGGLCQNMVALIRECQLPYIIMHHLTLPADKNIILPQNIDVIKQLQDWFASKIDELSNINNIIIDMGLGFGKNAAQDLEIIQRIDEFKIYNKPILLGHSKKSFIKSITLPNSDRELETNIISAYLMNKNIDYIRVHDVKETAVTRNIASNFKW